MSILSKICEGARKCRCEGGLDTILQAAAIEFAEKGYGGARVDVIAKAAGVNKATLYYQIGGKEVLYHAVLEQCMGRLDETLSASVEAAEDAQEKVHAFILAFADHNGYMRYVAPIALREVASGGAHLPDSALAHMGHVVGLLEATIAQGVDEGVFREANPMMVHMMIVGSLFFYAANGPIRERVAAANSQLADFPSMEEAAEHVADLVIAALKRGDF